MPDGQSVENRREGPRYILLSKSADYYGTIDEKRITIDSLYSFSRGGCGFLTKTPSKLEKGKTVTSVFIFKPYSKDPFKLEARIIYVSEINIRGKMHYLHGLKFSNPKDETIAAVMSVLESLQKSGKVKEQR